MSLFQRHIPHRVLCVCLGNICRSPGAHALFLHLLAQRNEHPPILQVDSAGTSDAHEGQTPDARLLRVLGHRGLHAPTRSRPIRSEDFFDFDTILAMDHHNLAWLEQHSPRGGRAQLGLILDWHPNPKQRGQDVPDPYYGNEQHFESALELLEPACRSFIHWIAQDHAPKPPQTRVHFKN